MSDSESEFSRISKVLNAIRDAHPTVAQVVKNINNSHDPGLLEVPLDYAFDEPRKGELVGRFDYSGRFVHDEHRCPCSVCDPINTPSDIASAHSALRWRWLKLLLALRSEYREHVKPLIERLANRNTP